MFMKYRILGRTGLKVSVFGIGSWQLSGSLMIDGLPDGFPDLGSDQARSIIKGCQDLGINLIDTAEIYGGGEGERRIGTAIDGQRDRWILSSKFGLRRGSAQERIINSHPDTIRTSLESSLRRLNTDYIDIYLYHSPPQPGWIEPGKEVLETLKQEGKIRFYGISTDDPQILKLLVNSNAVDVVSCARSLLNHPQEILNLVRANNLGLLSRGALMAGKLSGKYFHQSPSISADDFRYQRQFNWSKYQSYEKLIPPGTSMVGMSLRYLLDSDLTQTILLGGKSLKHYQQALTALEMEPLDPKICSEIERARSWQNLILRAKSLVRPIKKSIKKIVKRD
jgi:aryl-alcohol dehydrogenase-like predicted oxidoreductase